MKNKKTDEFRIIQKTDDGTVYLIVNGKFKQGKLLSYLRQKRKEKKK